MALHFYADVLLQLAGADITGKNQDHIIGIHEFQEPRALDVVTWRLSELISCQVYLCEERFLVLLLLCVHCRLNFEVQIQRQSYEHYIIAQ